MAVTFEFEAGKSFHFAEAFAKHFSVEVNNERVYLPAILGDGFIQEVYLDNGLALCLHNYTLQQKLILKRLATGSNTILTMKFDCRSVPMKANEVLPHSLFAESKGCEVELGTGNFFTELMIPAGEPILFLVIVTGRQNLVDLLKMNLNDHSVAGMLKESDSFVLHEAMTREMEQTLRQMSQINAATALPALLYQTKALELIYHLFAKLLTRAYSAQVVISPPDAEKIYEVRAEILKDLGVTPVLPELALRVGMGLTKMKQLFNQIFGKSIYNYYQTERMDQAAQLLSNLSVSETGYKVGFTNLSHFSRLFEKHHQMKPKRYKDRLKVA